MRGVPVHLRTCSLAKARAALVDGTMRLTAAVLMQHGTQIIMQRSTNFRTVKYCDDT